MDSVLNSMVVTAVFFAVAVVAGRRLQRTPKPYGAALPSVHVALFLLVAGGVIASIYKIDEVTEGKLLSTVSLYVAAVALLGNLIIGTAMLAAKQKSNRLILAHKLSTSLMAISIVSAIAFLVLRI